MGDARIAALDRFWELANARDFESAAKLYQPDATVDLAGRVARGRTEIARELASFVVSFPDLRYRTGERFVDGDVIVEEWMASGTHTVVFSGRPPTGASIRLDAITLYRFQGELVSSDRTYLDMSQVLLRTGVLKRAAIEGTAT
jgi:predicted ester cyclase